MNRENTDNRKMMLSTLWIFVTLNYLYCDVLSLMSPEMLTSLITTGGVGGMEMNEATLLGAAVLLEIPISLVLLSRVLQYRANRLANIIGGILMTFVMVGTLLMGAGYLYAFFATIEIAATLFIVWFAWRWPEPHRTNCRAFVLGQHGCRGFRQLRQERLPQPPRTGG